MGWIQTPLDALYAQYAGLFVAEMQQVLWAMAGMLLVIYVLRFGSAGLLRMFLDYALILLFASNVLAYWATPCPLLGGYSISGFFPALGEYYANQIGNKQLDILFQQGGTLLAAINAQHAGFADLVMLPVAWGVQIFMWIIEGVTFFTVAISYVMIGIIRLVGPLLIPWIIFPRTAGYFWAMLSSLMQYSFFRIVASALVFVIGTAVTMFISNVLHGDYSLANLAVNMGKFAVITILSVFMSLRADRITADIFQGGASAGSGVLGSAFGAAGRLASGA